MAEFLAASAGTWLTRRAVHHLDHQDDEAGDSNLTIEPFEASDSVVQRVCDSLGLASSAQVAGGARFWWESNLKEGSRSDEQAAVLVDVVDDQNPRQGFLLRDKGYIEKQPVMSTYSFADDGLLTITTRYDTNVGVERCWFVTEGVRIRVSSVQFLDGVSMTTYCTELRCPSTDQLEAISAQAQSRFHLSTPATGH
ncbi:phycobiliprotein lyase [Synechococcus sp. RedBA-s]|uniref:phycobiliprotein lyase n=1 Tax=Synechococcus sp. RedBA-s TaxID=2823741 RepID=UPI0020CBD6D0|nr:phycobiliprotein lyase [Synechococcus sp. RedBA-s]MCP9800353.1 phycobiliprotein lyase [Synechococcus sp. RedBA-s]